MKNQSKGLRVLSKITKPLVSMRGWLFFFCQSVLWFGAKEKSDNWRHKPPWTTFSSIRSGALSVFGKLPFASLPIATSLEWPSQNLHPPEYKKAYMRQVGCQSSEINFESFKWHAGDLLFCERLLYNDYITRARWSCRNRESVGGSASANVEASSAKTTKSLIQSVLRGKQNFPKSKSKKNLSEIMYEPCFWNSIWIQETKINFTKTYA